MNLSQFEIQQPGYWMELVHTECGEKLCNVDDGDTLEVLAAVAQDHICETGGR